MHLDRANLLSLTDAKGNKTTYTYDSLGRPILLTDALGRSYRFFYDKVGNLTARRDPEGKTTYYKYNALNELQRIIYPDFSFTHYTFDWTGNIIQIEDARGIRRLSYDKLNRLKSLIYPDGVHLDYSYDPNGNRTSLKVTGQEKLTYDYDELNRLITLTLPDKTKVHFSYDSLSRRTQTIYPNGAITTYTYDELSRIRQLTNKDKDGQIISQFSYTYDANSRRTRIDLTEGFITYSYDALNQLLKEEGVIRGKPFSNSYTYDQVGNRLSAQHNGHLYQYSHNPLNQLIKVLPQKNDFPHTPSLFFAYDKKGNLIQRKICQNQETFSYDYDNHLKAYHRFLDTATYTYNSQGQRITKTLNGLTTQYYYDGDELILEKSPTASIFYIYGPGLDKLIADSRAYFYHPDGLGSVVNITDAQGKEIASYTYQAFGLLFHQHQSEKITNPFLFTSDNVKYLVDFFLDNLTKKANLLYLGIFKIINQLTLKKEVSLWIRSKA